MPRKKGAPLSPAEAKQRKDAAQRSTGPVTDKGKKISAMNAWKDGQTARSVRSSMIGKPCKSTCPKFESCVFIKADKTSPGGKCLDVGDWNIVEENAEAIVAAQNGDMSKLQGLTAMLMGMNVSVIQQMFADIQARGIWITQDMLNAEGEVVGTKEQENPHIGTMIKLMDKLGINLPEFLATPQSQAKVIQEDEAQQTAAEFTRAVTRLIPSEMRMPAFDESEITDAEVVKDE
ncbi:hypothetical protein [Mariprofundus ferrooxydans]|uniref:hypothetical protein n=1 Tax=Mariprofundus ferrooxydans TaxID=314344 RepID=UPI0014321FE7|nr:hypothetical protein [Mariprofundus ferrooxydans]